jgi:hypothetical protein
MYELIGSQSTDRERLLKASNILHSDTVGPGPCDIENVLQAFCTRCPNGQSFNVYHVCEVSVVTTTTNDCSTLASTKIMCK